MRSKICVVLLAVLVAVSCSRRDADRDAMVAAVLEQARSDTLVDASSDRVAAIRHQPSGLICELPQDGAFDLEVFPASAANAGVYCSTASGETVMTWVAVYFGPTTTLDLAYAEALAQAIAPAAPRPWDGEPSEADLNATEGAPVFRVGRFTGVIDDQSRYLRLAISEKDGWFIQQIVAAPLAEAERAEAEAGVAWRRRLLELAGSAERVGGR